jgi:hypothetical protein
MGNSLIIGIIVSIILVATIVTISLLIWAEKSKNLFIRLSILVPFYIGIVFGMVKDIVKNFEDQRIFFATFQILALFMIFIGFIIAIGYEKWLSKLIKNIMPQDDDEQRRQ